MTNIVDLPKQSLAITVWDHNKSKQNDYIGEGLLIAQISKTEFEEKVLKNAQLAVSFASCAPEKHKGRQ